MSTTRDPRTGSDFLGYRIEALLGRGGMGVVYRAFDARLKRKVALKLVAPELSQHERFRERFLAETELAASLEHPNVVPIHDAGEVEGQLYLAMRYVEGSDLKTLLKQEGPLDPARTIVILAQVAAALDAAHAGGLVHRDVKPSNVLLDLHEHVYLADFGLSRRLAEQAPGLEATRSLGTPAYVAPEQIQGEEVDARADVYSLGCLLYECLNGRPPFVRQSELAVLFAHLEEQPPAADDALDPVIARALAKSPEDRFQTCRELVEAGGAALGIAAPSRPMWSRAPVVIALAGVALIAAAFAAFFLARGDGSPLAAQGGHLIRINPSSNRVVGSVPVGDGPAAVATGSGRVWVASYRDGTLWKFNPRTGGVSKIPAFGRPYAVTIHHSGAYVAALGPGRFAGNLSKFDAVSGGRVGGIDLFACSLASGAYGVWVSGCPNIQQLSSESATQDPRVRATVVIPLSRRLTAANYREALVGITIGAGSVWVAGDASDRRLWRIDPERHRIAATIDLGFPPGDVAVGGGAVWVTDQLGDRLIRIDPATNQIDRSIPVGRGAGGVTFGAGSVWVAEAIAHTVSRLDPETNGVVATIRVPASPQAVAIGDGSLWVVGDAR